MAMKLTKFDLPLKRKSLCKNVITKYFLETYRGVLVTNYTKLEVVILNTLDQLVQLYLKFCSPYYPFIYVVHHTTHLYILFTIRPIYICCSPYYPFIYFVHHTAHLYILFTIRPIYIILFTIRPIYICCSPYYSIYILPELVRPYYPFIYFVHRTTRIYIFCSPYYPFIYIIQHLLLPHASYIYWYSKIGAYR